METSRTRRAAPASAALVRRSIGDSRVRTIGFAYIFGVYAWLQAAGYRSAFPTAADRIGFARTFAGNDAIRLFYGYPYDVFTVGGYSAWRVGGTLAIAAAAFGLLAAVRALRSEEEAGRADLILAGAVSRRTYLWSALGACAAQAAVLGLAEWAGFVVGRLPVLGSGFLALSTASVTVVFVGIGALASQVASTGRGALGLAAAAGVGFWLVRVVADTVPGAAGLRWATPLGWAEASRPFAGTDAWALVLPLVAGGLMVAVSLRLAARRDVGIGLFPGRTERAPRLGLLGTPVGFTVRSQWGTLVGWVLAICVSGVVLGMVSSSVSGAGLSAQMKEQFAKFGAGSVATPSGFLAVIFMVFVVAVAFFACAQVGSARRHEVGLQLETLLAQPVGRIRWLGGHLLVAAGGVAVLGELAGLTAWAGAASQGARVQLSQLLQAGVNCVSVGLLFLGLASLAYALLPRGATAISYLLVGVSFLWYVVGALLRLPRWALDVTPFQHLGLVPAQAFQTTAGLVFVVLGALGGLAATVAFRRRDTLG